MKETIVELLSKHVDKEGCLYLSPKLTMQLFTWISRSQTTLEEQQESIRQIERTLERVTKQQ